MVYLPCLHVTGHIPFASGANVNIRFLLHNAVPHRKLVPTDRSMVYLPCLDITGHIPNRGVGGTRALAHSIKLISYSQSHQIILILQNAVAVHVLRQWHFMASWQLLQQGYQLEAPPRLSPVPRHVEMPRCIQIYPDVLHLRLSLDYIS